ncbi:hypothetical protein DFP72DRAFT_30398 [Ephemerocybe angulata]|uniref:Uncharacterized protein n=1 Tax=Ephemerocybe angulata TaxID=980116 RepID=A0A8H6IJB8_9AGAR|nr:hypothetical protein DFP72DRAFT_30398 [Tulosesus angulatus]
MKIPTSGSIILATLAISSSSASLAAPTGDPNTGHDGSLQHAGQAMENEERADNSMMDRDSESELEARDIPILSDILGGLPVVGPLLKPLLASQCAPSGNDPNAQGADSDPAAMARLQDAIGTVSSALAGIIPTGAPMSGLPSLPSGLPIPGGAPLQNIAGAQEVDSGPGGNPNDPGANPSGSALPFPGPTPSATPQPAAAGEASNSGSFLISPTTTVAEAQEAAPTQDPDYLSTAPASEPTSPGVPSGPPNTPVPVNAAPSASE